MAEYIVVCDLLELPYGSVFTTVQQFPYRMGDLALFSVIGFPDGEWLIAGRYHTEDGGDWIQLPGRRIDLPKEVTVDVIGLIVSWDTNPCLN